MTEEDKDDYESEGDKKYWTKTPSDQLNFWFDFLDSNGGELNQFSV
jgi:hypothetical protein